MAENGLDGIFMSGSTECWLARQTNKLTGALYCKREDISIMDLFSFYAPNEFDILSPKRWLAPKIKMVGHGQQEIYQTKEE